MLTPSHLLYGHNFFELPDEVKNEEDESSVHERLRYMARKGKHFWNHWVKEYLVNLRESYRNSKSYKCEAVKVEDVVTVHEEGQPRGKWRLAHVVRLITGKNGVVRGVEIELSGNKGNTRMERPLKRLYPLEISYPCVKDDDQENREERPPRRAAAIDSDWRRQMLDQIS